MSYFASLKFMHLNTSFKKIFYPRFKDAECASGRQGTIAPKYEIQNKRGKFILSKINSFVFQNFFENFYH